MDQQLTIPSIANFRQLGGLSSQDGRKIANNRLFRSSALDVLSDQDAQQLGKLSQITILDYRDVAEAAAKPDASLPNGNYLNLPANPPSLDVDAKVVEFSPQAIEAMNVDKFMTSLYQQLPFNNPAWQQLITQLQQDSSGAILQHCAVGKDRTGIGCAITLLLLGCDKQTIFNDYLQTTSRLDHLAEQVLHHWSGQASELAQRNFMQLLSVQEHWLAAAFQAVEDRYGSTQQWLLNEYGVTDTALVTIRNNWLIG